MLAASTSNCSVHSRPAASATAGTCVLLDVARVSAEFSYIQDSDESDDDLDEFEEVIPKWADPNKRFGRQGTKAA